MKTTTTLVASCWLFVGTMMVLSAIFSNEGSWVVSCEGGILGVIAVLGVVDLLRHRALGWWLLIGVNGLVAALWAWGMIRTYGVSQGIESVQDLLGTIIMLFLALCLIALIIDRPSKWDKPAADCRPSTED